MSGNMTEALDLDPRARRTRKAILDAFIALVGEQHYGRFGPADIAARAGVGRATFYEHYRGKDDLLHKSMRFLLVLIAAAADEQADESGIRWAVDHFWENRRLGRVVLAHPIAPSVRRALADILAETHPRPAAVQIAGAQLALIEAWVRGEISATQEEVVTQLRAVSRL